LGAFANGVKTLSTSMGLAATVGISVVRIDMDTRPGKRLQFATQGKIHHAMKMGKSTN
jgi:hypothetical protein